jgi:transposase-like protein
MLAEGKEIADVCRDLQVSEPTFYRWRNQFAGLKADDAKGLRDLERENSTLKRLLAKAELEKAALKEIARGILSPARRRQAVDHLIRVLGGQPALRLPRDRAEPCHPMLATGRTGDRRSARRAAGAGCVTTPKPIRGGDSGGLITTPAVRAGRSTTRRCNGCGARRPARAATPAP